MHSRYRATLAICTRNKALYLEKCLQTLSGQEAHKQNVRIIIINDHSTDGTDAVIRRFIQRETSPVIYKRHTITRGTAAARNHAVAICNTSHLIFIDDDVLLPRGWIRNMLSVIASYPDAALLGGSVIPKFPLSRREYGWLSEEIITGPAFAYVNYGKIPRYLRYDQSLITANCTLNLNVLGKEGYFNERLGETEKSEVKGEDVELNWRVMRKNLSVLYHPSIIVRHLILEDRLTKKNAAYECYIWGKTESMLHREYERINYKNIWLSKCIDLLRVCKNVMIFKTKPGTETFAHAAYLWGYIETSCAYSIRNIVFKKNSNTTYER